MFVFKINTMQTFIEYLKLFFSVQKITIEETNQLENICMIEIKFNNRYFDMLVMPMQGTVNLVDFKKKTITFSFKNEDEEHIQARIIQLKK